MRRIILTVKKSDHYDDYIAFATREVDVGAIDYDGCSKDPVKRSIGQGAHASIAMGDWLSKVHDFVLVWDVIFEEG